MEWLLAVAAVVVWVRMVRNQNRNDENTMEAIKWLLSTPAPIRRRGPGDDSLDGLIRDVQECRRVLENPLCTMSEGKQAMADLEDALVRMRGLFPDETFEIREG